MVSMRFPLLHAPRFWAAALGFPLGLAFLLWGETAWAEVESAALHLPKNQEVSFTLQEPVDALAVTLDEGEPVDIQVLEEGQWSAWQTLEPDTDASPFERTSGLLLTENVQRVRLRSDREARVTLHGIAVSSESLRHLEASTRKLPPNMIIPRFVWGADESLRIAKKKAVHRNPERVEEHEASIADGIRNCDLRARVYPQEFTERGVKFFSEKGEPLLWPQGYSKDVNLFIVHHTAESALAAKKSGVERMRVLYEYHTIARGWGDIGYNFVIDPEGNIYEGRAGGASIVGAHSFCNNVGTIGIALMGNFQVGEPPKAQLQGLRLLLIQLSDEYGIDPLGRTTHHGKMYPTIVGHRDVRPTACPGSYSYALFPQVRLAVRERDIASPLYSPVVVASAEREATFLSGLEQPLTLDMGEQKHLTLKFRNVSSVPWQKTSWILGEASPGLFFTKFLPYSFVAGFLEGEKVEPGAVGTFTVALQGGLSETNGTLMLTPVINNTRRLALDAPQQSFRVLSGSPHYTPVVAYFPPLHITGEDLTGTVKILNAGSVHWEKGTITEIEFGLAGGAGEVSVLSHPERIGPQEQGTFLVRFHNVDASGPYERVLQPHFADGSALTGTPFKVASRAEPLPAIALASTAETSGISPADIRRGKIPPGEGVVIETLGGTAFTLSPREQISIPLRIRAGEHGAMKSEGIAPVFLSDASITLRNEAKQRIRDIFFSPLSLRKFQTFDTQLTLIAPRIPGDYTVSLGNLDFTLTVSPSARYLLKQGPLRQITRRTTSVEVQREQRLERRARRAPRSSTSEKKQEVHIRIRLRNEAQNALLTAPSELAIEGEGNFILTEGSVHIGKKENSCHVSTADGEFIASVIRITPTNKKEYSTIVSRAERTNRFRGTLECRIMSGQMVWINELPLEQYLAGLAEEPDSEPYEKQRAFAIAARSYALYYVVSPQRKFPGLPYDGSDSPREFQAYGGVAFEEENSRWVEAVKDTAGKVLTWERHVIKAPYFSADSGRTRSALDVWGWTHTPYLDAKDDQWCQDMASSGHGVGMSGCGAEGQANEGKAAEEILEYYYPGTRLLPIESLEPY